MKALWPKCLNEDKEFIIISSDINKDKYTHKMGENLNRNLIEATYTIYTSIVKDYKCFTLSPFIS